MFLHQIPPSPAYFRAQVLRLLNQLGSLAIKNSAYLLPENTETIEDFQWLLSEIQSQGGEAWLFGVNVLGGFTAAELIEAFRALRTTDYGQLLEAATELHSLIGLPPTDPPSNHLATWRKLDRKFHEVRKIDFFDAPGRKEFEAVMKDIDKAIRPPQASQSKPDLQKLTGRTWVTRRGVKVDRIATAWLIRRFVDPQAKFRFVDHDKDESPVAGIRFDMFEGEFTHEGELCTFEVLLQHTGIRDPALDAIAQIVHDIDLKYNKYQRPETSGIAALILGITEIHPEDERRIEEGSRLWDATHAALGSGTKG